MVPASINNRHRPFLETVDAAKAAHVCGYR